MKKNLNIALDADGVIFQLFLYQMEKGLKKFEMIDNSIKIDGITIDNISSLSQTEKCNYIMKYVDEYCEVMGDVIDITSYDIHDIFKLDATLLEKIISKHYANKHNISYEEALTLITDKLKIKRQMFWLQNIYNYCTSSEVTEYVCEKIKHWQEEGHSVGNITARVFVTKNDIIGKIFRKILESVYKKHGIKFDYIDYCSERESPNEKMIACYKRGVDVIVEDKLDNALKISELGLTHTCLLNTPYNLGSINEYITRFDDFIEIDQFIDKLSLERYKLLGDKNYVRDNKFITLSNQEKSSMTKLELWDYYRQEKEFLKNAALNDEVYRSNYDVNKTENYQKFYKKIYPFLITPYKAVLNPKVINRHYLPFQDGIIYSSNHLSKADEFLISSALGNKPVHFLAASEFLDYFLINWFYTNLGCIFVDRKSSASKKRALEIMKYLSARELNLVIHPEGTRNNGRYGNVDLLPFQDGIFKVAQTTGAPIVPLTITNDYGFRSKNLVVRVEKPIIVLPNESISSANEKLYKITYEGVLKNNEMKEVQAVKKMQLTK